MSTLLPVHPFETLARLAAALPTEAEFLARFTRPVVLVPPRALVVADFDSTETGAFDVTPPLGIYRTQASAKSPLVRVFEDFREAAIVPIVKSDRNSFTQMITVGRADNNDIVLPRSTVSKLHGYFLEDHRGAPSGRPDADSRLRFQDAGSTNGLCVNAQRIPPRGSVYLEDNFELVLGDEVRLLYKTPAGLYQLARYVEKRLAN